MVVIDIGLIALTFGTIFLLELPDKTFVATLVLQLADAGRLSLDDTIEQYISSVPNGERITIRHLLGMRSGIANFLEDPDFLAALDFRVTLDQGRQVDGNLSRDGQVVGLDGDIPEAAELAAWIRSVVPAGQELIFYDQGYHFDVPLRPDTTPQEIIAGVGSG